MPPLDLTAPWWSLPLIVLDFETTGVDPLVCQPVSVAAARYERGKEVGHFYSLLNPGEPIPAGASEIHGVTDDMVKGSPTLVDVAPELYALAVDAVPVAFNSQFDRLIFQRFIAGDECPLFDPAQRWICPLVMLRKIDRYASGQGRHKLVACCARHGVQLTEAEAHNALADVRATAGLLNALVNVGKLNPRTPLGKLLDYIDGCRAFQEADRVKYLAKVKARDAQQQLPLDTSGAFGDQVTSEQVTESLAAPGDT